MPLSTTHQHIRLCGSMEGYLFLSFCDDAELDKYIIDNDNLTESGEYLLALIKKWLKDNVIEVEWEGEKARLWTPWTKR